MPKLINQKGAIQFIVLLVLLILLVGIFAAVYLVTSGPLKLFPKASVSKLVGPERGFTLKDIKTKVEKEEKVDVPFAKTPPKIERPKPKDIGNPR